MRSKSVTPAAARARVALTRARLPVDAALPQLPVLLDPEAMAPFLHRSLGPGAPLPDVRIRQVRYAPGTKILVRYGVGLAGLQYDAVAMSAARPYLDRRALKPESIALARLAGERAPTPMPLHFEPELEALVQWYPLDLELPALAEPPTRLLAELGTVPTSIGEVGGEPTLLRYRPRRRAVLRVGELVLKVYATHEDFAAANSNLLAAPGLRGIRTAEFAGSLPGRLVTAQSVLSGSTPAHAGDVAEEAGELLRELAGHNAAAETGLVVAGPADQLALAAASARLAAAIVPALAPRLEALLRELAATVPAIDRPVLAHGDFHVHQLVVMRGGLGVVDLDAMCLAPAALDPATFAARLMFGQPDDLDDACRVLEQLLDGYGARPLGMSWYLATSILRHSRSPFRYLDPHWPERVGCMVEAAAAALRR